MFRLNFLPSTEPVDNIKRKHQRCYQQGQLLQNTDAKSTWPCPQFGTMLPISFDGDENEILAASAHGDDHKENREMSVGLSSQMTKPQCQNHRPPQTFSSCASVLTILHRLLHHFLDNGRPQLAHCPQRCPKRHCPRPFSILATWTLPFPIIRTTQLLSSKQHNQQHESPRGLQEAPQAGGRQLAHHAQLAFQGHQGNHL